MEKKSRLGGGSSQLLRLPGHPSSAGAGASRQPSPRQPEVPAEQQHVHHRAAFEPLSITRLLSQSHPGAFVPGTTRRPFLRSPRLVLCFLKPLAVTNTHAGRAARSSHNKPKTSTVKARGCFAHHCISSAAWPLTISHTTP